MGSVQRIARVGIDRSIRRLPLCATVLPLGIGCLPSDAIPFYRPCTSGCCVSSLSARPRSPNHRHVALGVVGEWRVPCWSLDGGKRPGVPCKQVATPGETCWPVIELCVSRLLGSRW